LSIEKPFLPIRTHAEKFIRRTRFPAEGCTDRGRCFGLDWMEWDGMVWYGVSDWGNGKHSQTWLEVKANNVTPDNEHH